MDDKGRLLDTKEVSQMFVCLFVYLFVCLFVCLFNCIISFFPQAFRFMSHKFHGRGSGRKKMEKRLKKIKEERVRFIVGGGGGGGDLRCVYSATSE